MNQGMQALGEPIALGWPNLCALSDSIIRCMYSGDWQRVLQSWQSVMPHVCCPIALSEWDVPCSGRCVVMNQDMQALGEPMALGWPNLCALSDSIIRCMYNGDWQRVLQSWQSVMQHVCCPAALSEWAVPCSGKCVVMNQDMQALGEPIALGWPNLCALSDSIIRCMYSGDWQRVLQSWQSVMQHVCCPIALSEWDVPCSGKCVVMNQDMQALGEPRALGWPNLCALSDSIIWCMYSGDWQRVLQSWQSVMQHVCCPIALSEWDVPCSGKCVVMNQDMQALGEPRALGWPNLCALSDSIIRCMYSGDWQRVLQSWQSVMQHVCCPIALSEWDVPCSGRCVMMNQDMQALGEPRALGWPNLCALSDSIIRCMYSGDWQRVLQSWRSVMQHVCCPIALSEWDVPCSGKCVVMNQDMQALGEPRALGWPNLCALFDSIISSQFCKSDKVSRNGFCKGLVTGWTRLECSVGAYIWNCSAVHAPCVAYLSCLICHTVHAFSMFRLWFMYCILCTPEVSHSLCKGTILKGK